MINKDGAKNITRNIRFINFKTEAQTKTSKIPIKKKFVGGGFKRPQVKATKVAIDSFQKIIDPI